MDEGPVLLHRTRADGTEETIRMPSEEQARILLADPRFRRADPQATTSSPDPVPEAPAPVAPAAPDTP